MARRRPSRAIRDQRQQLRHDEFETADIKPSPRIKKVAHAGRRGEYNGGGSNGKGRFVVVGSSRWIDNSFLRFNGNRDLFLNMMNWLSPTRT